MATTYAQLVERVARLISDPDVETYAEEMYHDAVCAAHDAIIPWLPNYKSVTVDVSSGSGGVYALPSDVYDIQSVRVGTGKYLPRATLAAGTARSISTVDLDWIENPKGYLSLSRSDLEDDIDVHYLAYWPKPSLPTSTSFAIVVPECGHMGMIYYAASIVVVPVVVDISTLGPFKLRVESGTPEHNPMKQTSSWFRELFIQEMKMMPPYQKARA